MLLAGSFAVICLGSAVVYALFGFWMVLPFAGAEVIFVTACLYWTVRKLSVKEVITIGDDDIKLEWGLRGPERSVKLPRYWSSLDFDQPDSPFEVGSLCLQAHGKRYALGLGLGREEKKDLYKELKQLI